MQQVFAFHDAHEPVPKTLSPARHLRNNTTNSACIYVRASLAYTLAMSDSQKPEVVLRQAAEAAAQMLPDLENEHESLRRHLDGLAQRIGQLRGLVNIFAGEPPPEAEAHFSQMLEHVMIRNGGARIGELKEALEGVIGRTVAESTLYGYLTRGKAEGRYTNEGNRWSITGTPRARVRVRPEP